MSKHLSTIKEIASALGVATSTVSRALADDPRIGLRTRMRVQEAARAANYVPNQAAKSLRQHRTATIGVLLPQLREEFFSLALMGIEDALDGTGYQVFIAQSRDNQSREANAVLSFLNSRVDGVIASVAAESVDFSHFAKLQEFGVPIVFFDRAPNDVAAHRVLSAVEAGAEAAVKRLLVRGCQKIALLNGPEHLEISRERLRGYRKALADVPAETPTNEVVRYTTLQLDDIEKKMAAIFDAPSGPPDAVLAFNDYVSLHAMRWCKKNGHEPNKDVLFASFANLPITHFLDNPPAFSVEQFAKKMGEQAAELLLSALQKGDEPEKSFQKIVLETELIEH